GGGRAGGRAQRGWGGGVAGRGGGGGGGGCGAGPPPYEPADATVGVLLHHRLSVLRYHRADAHATAWQAAGLTSEGMRQLPAGPGRAALEAGANPLAGGRYCTRRARQRVGPLAGGSAHAR